MAQVAADAKWVVHFDLDRFAASQTCAALIQDSALGGRFRQQMIVFKTLLGADPLKDLRHVTFYGDETSGSRGVALINGNLNADTLVQRLSTNPQYQARVIGKATVHQWHDRNSGTEMAACFFSPRLVVMGSDVRAVMAALEVLNGRKPGLTRATTELPLPGQLNGAFLLAATRGYDGPAQDSIRSDILRNTRAATLEMAENNGVVGASLMLTATSTNAAAQIEQTLKGLVVVASLSSDTDGLARLAERSEISCKDNLVNMRLGCPAKEAAALLATALAAPDGTALVGARKPKRPASTP